MRPILFALSLLTLGLHAQEPFLRFDPAHHGVAGARPGTERWLITFKRRGFDLEAFRSAIYANRPAAEVAAIVAGLEVRMREDQRPFVTFVESIGGRVSHQWWLVNGCAVELAHASLERIAAHENVATMEPDKVCVPLFSGTAGAFIPTSMNAQNHNARFVQQTLGIRGSGVGVAILDSSQNSNYQGLGRPHMAYFQNANPGLQSLLLANIQLGAMNANNPNPHGTGVCGIAAGAGWSALSNSEGHAPDANKIGYAIADFPNGDSFLTTITTGWQRIATDQVLHGIKTANMSYAGSPNPTSASQQALDSAAYNANILITVAAGNDGTQPNPTANSQSAANGLAVGAVMASAKVRYGFSSFGPLPGEPTRTYPDLMGVGGCTMPLHDNELSSYFDAGTSFAAPQVCGAAALVRAANPALTAVETKAILLASTENILAQNPGAGRNQIGVGFLRDDLAVRMALNDRINVVRATQSGVGIDWFVPMDVTQGRTYSVAVTWHRRPPFNQTNWSDFTLTVLDYRSSPVIVAFDSVPGRNLYRKLSFVAPRSGTIFVTTRAISLQAPATPNEFALAHNGDAISGTVTPYGASCSGTGPQQGLLVLPAAAQNAMGNSTTHWPLRGDNERVQQVLLGSEQPVSRNYTGLWFRQGFDVSRTGGDLDLQVRMGHTTASPTTLSSTYFSNLTSGTTLVFNRKWVRVPPIPATPNTNPAQMLFYLPFDTAFPYNAASGLNTIVDVVCFQDLRLATSITPQYFVDALNETGPTKTVGRVRGSNAGTQGLVEAGRGAVMGFTFPGASGAGPLAVADGLPAVARSMVFRVEQGAPGALAVFNMGYTQTAIDMTPVGAPGCFQLAAIDASLGLLLNASGRGVVPFAIPNNAALVGTRVFAQFGVVDPLANGLGVVVSRGLDCRVGEVDHAW